MLGYSKRSEAAVQIASAQFRNTSYGFYVDDVWKITSEDDGQLWVSDTNLLRRGSMIQPAQCLRLPFPSISVGGPVADRKLHPYFLRQGNGDPYEGVNFAGREINVRRDGAARADRMVKTDYNRFCSATRHHLESDHEMGDPRRLGHLLFAGHRKSAVRYGAKSRRPYSI